jgi:pimeloyl-ACP methyl ester carboxylesterase
MRPGGVAGVLTSLFGVVALTLGFLVDGGAGSSVPRSVTARPPTAIRRVADRRSPAAARPATLRMGGVVLHRCGDGYPGFCGHIMRPLDPGLAGGPRIPIRVELVPARDGRPPGHDAGTIVAVEGGPGYPSTGTYEEYTGTFRRSLADHDLLMVDNRGTGDSALIRCRALQRFHERSPAEGPRFDRLVGRCAAHLDREYRTRAGRPIHAADLFATEYAVGDLHAVLRRLHTGRVQLYGDSYGSWFAQAFAARYPRQLRSVILDSTYPIHRLDPWYASSGLVARQAMDRVCARDPGCRTDAGTGTPVTRLARLLARLRARPIHGSIAWLGGRRTISVTPRRLVDLVQDGGSDPWPWRELDASVRAALAGDATPLLRLAVEGDDNGGDADPTYFSDGDYMAVSCTDYPQLFAMTAGRAERRRQLRQAIAAEPRSAFRPFTPAEWVTMSAYSETYDACLDWPRPVHRAPVQAPVGARRLPARVPVLIVGGDLDDLTPLHDARRFGPTLGRTVRVVDLPNTVHVTSEGDTYLTAGAACARRIIDRFVAAPGRLRTLDTRCAGRIPHLHTPGAYPRTLAAARPAHVVAGPRLAPAIRRAVTVAAGALGDVTILHAETGAARGPGLRGGSWSVRAGAVRLHRVRFVADATVSGAGRFRLAGNVTRGRLTVRGRGLPATTIVLRWDEGSTAASAQVGATRLTLPAP